MRIKEVSDERILFDNGSVITFDHSQDCCEWNYANFTALDPLALHMEFDEPLEFEAIQDAGFRFGNRPLKMFFVPCYSEQNGYYSSDVDIYYNGKHVLNFPCEEHIY